MNKLISIIVPIYNSEKYLKRSISSILCQTYKNIEVLLINDGSTDNSIKICQEFSRIDNRIKIIDKKNSGVSNTRNKGIELSTGELIMFVDSDDFIEKDYIEKMYYKLENLNLDTIVSGMQFCDNKEKIIRKELYTTNTKELKFDNLYKDIINTLYFCSACKTLFKKSVIIENDIKFNEKFNYGEDLLFSFTLLKNSKKIGYLSNCGYYYRQNSDSSTHENNLESIEKYFDDNIILFNMLKQYIKDDETLIANRLFTKLNITLTKIIQNKNIRYKEFVVMAKKYLEKYKENEDINKVNLKIINYETRLNIILVRLLKNNYLFLYYMLVKLMYFAKNILRR